MGSQLNNPTVTTNYKVLTIYSGNGADVSKGDATGEATASIELSAIPTGNLSDKAYVFIAIQGNHTTQASSGNSAWTRLQIETKEVGGAYATDLNKTINSPNTASFSGGFGEEKLIGFIHTLTAGERLNGLQIKITAGANITKGGGSANSAFTNTQMYAIGYK